MDNNPQSISTLDQRAVVFLGVIVFMVFATMDRAHGKTTVYARVQIATPYVDIYSGPGRGYPIFHIVKKGEWIDVMKRHTDWFKIRTLKGVEGWMTRAQMETTITELGVLSRFRENAIKEFFSSRLEVGAVGGQFKGDPIMVAQLGYKLNKNFSTDLSFAQVSGAFSTFRLTYANLTAYPWHDTRFSPYFSIGVGSFDNVPRGTLVSGNSIAAVAANVGVGVRFYLARNFVFRTEYRIYTAVISDTETRRFPAWMLGFSFFY